MERKFVVERENVMVISENNSPIAILRKNGHLEFLAPEMMGQDDIFHLLQQLTGQPIIKAEDPRSSSSGKE